MLSPLISVNTLSLAPNNFQTQLNIVAKLGADAIGPEVIQLQENGTAKTKTMLSDAGLAVSQVTHRAFGFNSTSETRKEVDRLNRTIDLAASVDAKAVCFISGGRGKLSWADAATQFCDAIQPCVTHAKQAGIMLGLEPASHLYAEATIVHRAMDVVALAERANIGVGLDFFSCWVDSDFDDAIARAAGRIAFVQISDQVAGDRSLPCRAIPGDGMLPLKHILTKIMSTAYSGILDLEILGPRIEAEGHEAGLARALQWLNNILDEISSSRTN